MNYGPVILASLKKQFHMIQNSELLDIIMGRISENNMKMLQKYIGQLSKNQDKVTVVDVGTCRGLSAITMALVGDNVTVLTIDPSPDSKSAVEEYAKKYGIENRIKSFEMGSTEFGKDHCPLEIDACFLDGRHELEGIREDIEFVGAKVRKGGYIMIHDHNLYNYGPVLNEFENKLYKFIEEEKEEIDPRTQARPGTVWIGERL